MDVRKDRSDVATRTGVSRVLDVLEFIRDFEENGVPVAEIWM